MSLATSNNAAEDICIATIVVAELKLRNVQRHIFGADFVERAHYAALKDAPKTLNRISMHGADNVLAQVVINELVRIFFIQPAIAVPSVGRQQANAVRHRLVHKQGRGFDGQSLQYARNHVALALHCANDRSFAAGASASLAVVFFVPMTVAVFAANPSLVNLDNTAEFLLRLNHRRADFVCHVQGSLVGAKAHLPLNLERANSFFARGHQVDDLEPLPQRLVGVLKDRPCQVREAIALVWRALIALPLKWHRSDRKNLGSATARADNRALRPAARNEIRFARFLIGKHVLELAFGHLVDGPGAARCHIRDSSVTVTGDDISMNLPTSQVPDNRPREHDPLSERDSM